MEVPVERSYSPYNEVLELLLVKGRYQLCTKQAIYSYADKYDNFRLCFEQVKLPEDGASVLLLGFGLGSIPYMLENTFGKSYQYTAVEIDEEVVYLASKYVLDELKSDIMVHTTDAVHFMQYDTSQYDLICMDIFEDDQIPDVFESEDFLKVLKDSLTSKGVLVYNRLAYNDSILNKTRVFFQTVFTRVFPQSKSLEILGNWMLLNDKKAVK